MYGISLSDLLYLWQKWSWAHREYGVWPSIRQFHRILKAYSEKHRAYHTLQHLVDCFRIIDQHYPHQKIDGIYYVVMAIFFHDIVYEVKTGARNEEESAEIAFQYSYKIFGAHFSDTIHRLILQTKTHTLPDTASLIDQIMNDVDMHVLARAWPSYLEYARGVWAEYSVYGKDVYRTNRIKFLRGLDMSKVFYTREGRKWMRLAQKNVNHEVTVLTKRPHLIFGE